MHSLQTKRSAVAKLKAGDSVARLAKEYKVSQQTIQNWVTNLGNMESKVDRSAMNRINELAAENSRLTRLVIRMASSLYDKAGVTHG